MGKRSIIKLLAALAHPSFLQKHGRGFLEFNFLNCIPINILGDRR